VRYNIRVPGLEELSVRDRWNAYFILRNYPIINLRDVSLESGETISNLKETVQILIQNGILEKLGNNTYRIKIAYSDVEKLMKEIERSTMRDWTYNDCHDLYCHIEDFERKIINRLVFSTGKVSVRVLMEIIGSKGYFKIMNFERKVNIFSRDKNLLIPISREKTLSSHRTSTFYKICSENFKTYMQEVIKTFRL